MTDIDTLDEVYMYSRELSPFEVKTLYDNCNFGSAKTRELTCVKYSAGSRPSDNGGPGRPDPEITGAPNDNFRGNICSEDNLRSRIFGTFVVKFLASLLLLGFSNI